MEAEMAENGPERLRNGRSYFRGASWTVFSEFAFPGPRLVPLGGESLGEVAVFAV